MVVEKVGLKAFFGVKFEAVKDEGRLKAEVLDLVV